MDACVHGCMSAWMIACMDVCVHMHVIYTYLPHPLPPPPPQLKVTPVADVEGGGI